MRTVMGKGIEPEQMVKRDGILGSLIISHQNLTVFPLNLTKDLPSLTPSTNVHIFAIFSTKCCKYKI